MCCRSSAGSSRARPTSRIAWARSASVEELQDLSMSLIGVFVTVSGIVVGSDTSLRERGTTDFTVASAPKFTICGSSAYAGLTGITRWIVDSGATNATTYDAMDVVKET